MTVYKLNGWSIMKHPQGLMLYDERGVCRVGWGGSMIAFYYGNDEGSEIGRIYNFLKWMVKD